ncbi:Hint domain-containing protein [Microbispora triticiradicis]|uniref:Hint domain-containing protein n=1 Tax=Microbispora triticiradicis TaxID=2200763 RepID=UPI001AD6EDB8|nr:Hint domain-containing protein [Microbispora triticiradicis]MBO4274627.1 hypothetical protein [Microbispora triticiradicis]
MDFLTEDMVGCASGKAASCALFAASFIPGEKIAAGLGRLALKAAEKYGAKLGRVAEGIASRVGGKISCALNSFVPDTRVLMADGSYKPIEQVEVGDFVLATDPVTGSTEPRPVTAVITGYGEKQLVQLTIDGDGREGGEVGTVTSTDHHPFWDADSEHWFNAKDLTPGMHLRAVGGSKLNILSVSTYRRNNQRVYNLSIGDIHTYSVVVAGADILVHNSACGNGLRGASRGLKGLFDGGTVRGKSINQLRAGLLKDGFRQTLTRNKKGYLFTNDAGEQVRIMRRNGGWDMRIQNKGGNYLDEYGNVAPPNATRGISVGSY